MEYDIETLPAFEKIFLPAADAIVNRFGADAAPETKRIIFYHTQFNEWLYVHYRPSRFDSYYTVALFMRFYKECSGQLHTAGYSYLASRQSKNKTPYLMEAVPVPLHQTPFKLINADEPPATQTQPQPLLQNNLPLTWRGTQKQLAELLISLVDKGWLEPFPPGALSAICRTVCATFDLQHTQRSPNSDVEKSFYQIMKPDVDSKTYKATYPKVFAKNTVPSFDKIKQNRRR
jgi:hypothetical protein